MADKRITTVDIMNSPDKAADHLLAVRGVQRDVRRLLIQDLLALLAWDIHDDIDTELTSPAGADRLAISDESSPGFPLKYVTLARLQSFFTNAFDLHDDVDTELTAAADADRLLISDEDQSGDPQKWISVLNLLNSRNVLRYQKLTDEIAVHGANQLINHSLGRVPVGYQLRLICKTATAGYSVGDETIPIIEDPYNGTNSRHTGVYVSEASNSRIRVRTRGGTFLVLHKTGTGADVWISQTDTKWKFGLTIWG